MHHIHQSREIWICLLLGLLTLAGCGRPESTENKAAGPDNAVVHAESLTGRQVFVILPERSEASYVVEEEFFGLALPKYGIPAGLSKAIGRTQVQGQFELDPDNIAAQPGQNRFTVAMNMLKSNMTSRDEWLRDNGPKFNEHPQATFVATRMTASETSLRAGKEIPFDLTGDLTVRKITKVVTFKVKAKLTGDLLGGFATARLRMSDFGIQPPSFANTLTAANEFDVEVRFTAQAKR